MATKKFKRDEDVSSFFINEIHKAGGTAQMAKHLMRLGEKACLAWLIRRFVPMCENMRIDDKLTLFAQQYDVPFNAVRNAYYFPTHVPLKELEDPDGKYPEYREVRRTVLRIYPYFATWESLFPFVWRYAKIMAIEILVEENKHIYDDIEVLLNVSKSTIIRAKKRMLEARKGQLREGGL